MVVCVGGFYSTLYRVGVQGVDNSIKIYFLIKLNTDSRKYTFQETG